MNESFPPSIGKIKLWQSHLEDLEPKCEGSGSLLGPEARLPTSTSLRFTLQKAEELGDVTNVLNETIDSTSFEQFGLDLETPREALAELSVRALVQRLEKYQKLIDLLLTDAVKEGKRDLLEKAEQIISE